MGMSAPGSCEQPAKLPPRPLRPVWVRVGFQWLLYYL